MLRDYGNKPVRVANMNGESGQASFQQAFPEGAQNYVLENLAASPNGQMTGGDFQLQVGVDAPEALKGQGQPNTESLLKLAIPVKVGLKLEQIVSIDQPNEIMNDVGTLKLEWTDPALASNPDDCNCTSSLYTETSYSDFLKDVKGKWPDFTFFNQQGNRWAQNRLIEVESTGAPDRALAAGHRALEIAEALGERDLAAATNSVLGMVYQYLGQYRRSMRFNHATIEALPG